MKKQSPISKKPPRSTKALVSDQRQEGGGSAVAGHPPRGLLFQRWLFRVLALTLVPLLLLGGAELVLRLGGYGYPTGFFLKTRIGGREVFAENQKFGYRFFPPAMARVPEPLAVPVEKPPGTYRVVVFGESAALGDPEPAYGLPRMLEILLRSRYPKAQFEVVNTAMTAINSHAILPIARDAAQLKGDIWVVYMGNNEVYGPFGAGTVFGPQTLSLPFIRAGVALKASRLGQGLSAVTARWGNDGSRPKKWGGLGMFLDQQMRAGDPRLDNVYAHFQRNLEDFLKAGRRAGAKIIVCTVASNLKDFPPFGSLHAPQLTAAVRENWEKLYTSGVALESGNKFSEALDLYLQAAKLDDQFAEPKFRLGRCYLNLGRLPEARQSFALARDLDTLRFRADSKLNQIIQATAGGRSAEGIYLLDFEARLAEQSLQLLPGEDFFHEHVHFNFQGNYVLARSVAEALEQAPSGPLPNTGRGNFLTRAECEEQLAFTAWDRSQVLKKNVRRMQEAPYTQQMGHTQRLERLRKAVADLEPQVRPALLGAMVDIYGRALARAGDDWILHDRSAQLFATAGDAASAEKEWRRVLELRPQYFAAYYRLGNLFNGLNRGPEAEQTFVAALGLRPDSVEARNGLGLALAKQDKLEPALEQFTKVLNAEPDSLEAHLNLASVLAQKGSPGQAVRHYEEIVRLKPNDALAHTQLGLALAGQRKFPEAIAQYSAGLALDTNSVMAHYSLANALIAVGQAPAAMEHYARALDLNPNFAEAHLNLGVEYAKQRRMDQALKHFEQAAQAKPDYADAQLNLGIALVKLNRSAEALMHFEEVLRLDPRNAQAQAFLQAWQRGAPVPR